MVEPSPSLRLTDHMWEWLQTFPQDVIDSDHFISEINRVGGDEDWLPINDHTRMCVIGRVREKDLEDRLHGK